MRVRAAFALFVSSVFLLSGCGGNSVTTTVPPTGSSTISVAVTPTSAQTVDANQTIPLTATVTNDSSNKGVTWTVSSGGGSVASSTGLTNTYTAPAVQASAVVITATSVADPTKAATVSVTVNATPAITSSSPLPAGYVGVAYSTQVSAVGGTGTRTITLTSGTLPNGLTLTGAGVISGTPTVAGTSTFTLQVTDSAATPVSTTAQLSLTIGAMAINTMTLPGAVVGTAYPSTQLSTSGSNGAVTYSVASGSLPAGITLSSTGAIGGTPTAAGTSSFTVKAVDSTGQVATMQFSIVTAAQLTLANVILPVATAGQPIASYQFQAQGGTTPLSYGLASGSTLPNGLSLSSAGVLSGTPTAAGTYTFNVTATDSGSTNAGSATPARQQATSTVTLTVSNLAYTGSVLPNGTVNQAYNTSTSASGGTAPYTYALASGSMLPAGLNLNPATGAITGTPTTAGTYTFSITATDAASHTATATFSITIVSTLTFANVALPAATANTAITNYQFAASGGTPPYTYLIAAGSTLPAGLSLSTSGLLSGTPTTSGTYTFGVLATDSTLPTAQQATSTVTLTVNPAASLTITPTQLPNAIPQSPYTQTLNASGGNGTYNYTLVSGNVPAGLTVESNGVVDGQPTASTGSYTFTVKATDSASHTGQQTVTLNVSNTLSSGVNNNLLNGNYAYLFTGYNNGTTGTHVYGTATVGQLVFDGVNSVTGTFDINSAVTGVTTQVTLSGSYRINADNRGTLVYTLAGASSPTTFVISIQAVTNNQAGQFRVIEYDDQYAVGVTGSGLGALQTGTYNTAVPTGGYVLAEVGETCGGCNTGTSDFGPLAQVGAVNFASGAVVSAGSELDTKLTTNQTALLPGSTGTVTLTSGTTGRGTITLTDSGATGSGTFTGQPLTYVFYAVSPTSFYLLSTGDHSNGYALLSGTATLRNSGTLTGNGVAYISGNLPGDGTSMFSRQVGVRIQRFATSGSNVTTSGYEVQNGTPGTITAGTGATFTTNATLGTVQFTDTDGTPYNFYMTGDNSGYSLGLGGTRGVVRIEPQTTTTFSPGLYTWATLRSPTNDYQFLGSLSAVNTTGSTTAGTATENEYYVLYDEPVGDKLYKTANPFTVNYTTVNSTGYLQFGTTGSDYRGFVINGSRFINLLDQNHINVPLTIYEK